MRRPNFSGLPSGRPAWMLEWDQISVENVRLDLIAKALSQINRFNGRTHDPWSVANHSLFVLELLPSGATRDMKLMALCHDVHEVWTGDISRRTEQEFKTAIDCYKRRIDDHIFPILGVCRDQIAAHERAMVHECDILAGTVEMQILGMPSTEWGRVLQNMTGEYVDAFWSRRPPGAAAGFWLQTYWEIRNG